MLCALVAIIILLPIHAFISTWGGTVIGPLEVWKSWKEILLLAMVPIVAAYCWIRKDIAKLLWGRWINKYITLYFFFTLIFAVTSDASANAAIAGLLMNLRFLAIFLLAQLVVASKDAWVKKVTSFAPAWLLWTTIGLSVVAIAQVFLLPKDFLTHFGYSTSTISPYILVDQNPDALRAFATMRGPNELGAYLIVGLALAGWLLVKRRQVLLAGSAMAFGLIALGLTGSRSAWLGVGVAAICGAMFVVPRDRLLFWAKRLAIPAIVLAGLAFSLATTVPAVRLVVFHSSPGDTSLTEGSTDAHWQATYNGIQDIAAHPFGQGVGVAGPASYYNDKAEAKIAENYFVQIGQETGVLGLATLLIIMAFVGYDLWCRRTQMWSGILLASFAGFTIISMLLHGWADDPTSMTWWALAGLFAYTAGSKKGE